MLPSNVGHQHNSQNNFKTAGCTHSITMLINNYPTGKRAQAVPKPGWRGRLEVFRPWTLWSWVLQTCSAFGKACISAVSLWVKPCQSPSALKKTKVAFSLQRAPRDGGRRGTNSDSTNSLFISSSSAKLVKLFQVYSRFAPQLWRKSGSKELSWGKDAKRESYFPK